MVPTNEVERVVRAALAGPSLPAGSGPQAGPAAGPGPGVSLSQLEVIDVEVKADLVRITLEHPGGIDLDTLAQATRVVSDALDAHGAHAPSSGPYTLEVSSPGLERVLRTPEHFRRYVGTVVAVKTRPGVPGDRRARGLLVAADDAGIQVAEETPGAGAEVRRLSYLDIERARTVFEWGRAPGGGGRGPGRGGARQGRPTGAGRTRLDPASEKPPTKKATTS